MTLTPLLAMVEPPPLDLGFLEILATIAICAAIFAFTGKKLREDIQKYLHI